MQKNWIYLFLLISLGANLFFAGYYIGGKSDFRMGFKPHGPMHLKGIIKELPKETRKQLSPMLDKSKVTSRENKRKIHREREKLLSLMSEPELNIQAVKDTMNTIKSLSSENMDISQTILFEAITHASFASRIKMVEAMKHGPRGPHRKN